MFVLVASPSKEVATIVVDCGAWRERGNPSQRGFVVAVLEPVKASTFLTLLSLIW